MNRHVNSRLEMGARALEFSQAHPMESSGYATTLRQLKEQLVRADQLAKEQERGTTEVRAATAVCHPERSDFSAPSLRSG
ncbi:MAG TPA: hypothetical protein VGP44_09520 [Gemmatimonadales bacterium]|nr:hypothetical protein [Gemmatimonadales bacterium]